MATRSGFSPRSPVAEAAGGPSAMDVEIRVQETALDALAEVAPV